MTNDKLSAEELAREWANALSKQGTVPIGAQNVETRNFLVERLRPILDRLEKAEEAAFTANEAVTAAEKVILALKRERDELLNRMEDVVLMNLIDAQEAQHRRTVEAVLEQLYLVATQDDHERIIRTMPRPTGEETDDR